MAKDSKREYGTGGISQCKDGRWVARMRIGYTESGKPKIKALYGKTEKEAKKKLKDFQKEFIKNDQTVVERSTVSTYMKNWLYTTKKNELKPTSFDRLEQTVMFQVIPEIGHIQIASIKSQHVQDMVNSLKSKGMSYSTTKKAYDAVNDCFRTGLIRREVLFNPALGVTVPPQRSFGTKEIKYYSKEESSALISTATAKYKNGKRIYRLGDVVALDLNTGLRLGELLGLKWEDIDLDNMVLSVRETRVVVKDRDGSTDFKNMSLVQDTAKSASSIRDVSLNDVAYNALISLYHITGDNRYVLSTSDGHPVQQRYLDRMLRKIEISAGMEKKIYGFHSLRHTFATRLFDAGVDVKTVSEILGHADVTVTYNTYIHLIPDVKKKAVMKINA